MPVQEGDEVTTRGGPAMVQFRDGTSVTLQPNSSLRIEGQTGNPSVRVTRGGAGYDLAPASRIRVVNSRGDVLTKALDNAITNQVRRDSSLTDPFNGGLVYRSRAGREPGVVLPMSNIFVGQFASGINPATGASGPQIILPNGMTFNLTSTTSTVNGASVTTYTVASVSVPIQTATGGVTYISIDAGTATGAPANVAAAVQQLIGAQVGGVPTGTGQGTFVFTPSGGNAPLPPSDIAAALQTTANQSLQNAVTAGTVPPESRVPTPAPVTTGQFSASGA